MFDVTVFNSGSSGNCIYVDTGDCKFLLDAGLSIKDTKAGLRGSGVRLSDIDYILVTHGHSDHVKGLKNIVEKYDTKVITSEGENLILGIPASSFVKISHRKTVEIANTKVTAYKIWHDTPEALCFSVENSIGEKLLYLTDCGTDEGIDVEEHDVYIIEANYYTEGILKSLQSDVIKVFQYNRTTSGTGHMELNQTLRILKDSIGDSTKHIILSHLSSANGNGDLFKQKAIKHLGFENVDIATSGLHVKVGEETNVF